jgi:hypothetical protein
MGSSTTEPGATDVSACICQAGFTGDITAPGDECAPCPVGEYKEESGPGTCTACPEGRTTEEEGSGAIADCLCEAGTFATIPDPESECEPCPEDTYKEELGDGQCNACPASSTTDGESGTAMRGGCLCDAGYTGNLAAPDTICDRAKSPPCVDLLRVFS